MKVFLDAGHGGRDPGAVAGGVQEKTFTLDIDSRIAKLLKEHNITVERTRTTDVFVDSTPRATKVKNSKAKYCISSHINAGKGTGAEVLISKYNDGKLANEILKELTKLGLRNRGVKKRTLKNGQDYYYIHRLTGSVTTLIVEYGFIDTKADRDFISNANNRQKCAEAVVRAICKVEGIKYKEVVKKPPTPSTSNADRDLFYRVVTGSFNNRKNAEERIELLKKAGFDSFIDIYEK